jgi:hypothetical protein
VGGRAPMSPLRADGVGGGKIWGRMWPGGALLARLRGGARRCRYRAIVDLGNSQSLANMVKTVIFDKIAT